MVLILFSCSLFLSLNNIFFFYIKIRYSCFIYILDQYCWIFNQMVLVLTLSQRKFGGCSEIKRSEDKSFSSSLEVFYWRSPWGKFLLPYSVSHVPIFYKRSMCNSFSLLKKTIWRKWFSSPQLGESDFLGEVNVFKQFSHTQKMISS